MKIQCRLYLRAYSTNELNVPFVYAAGVITTEPCLLGVTNIGN